ncbi:MAG: HAD-IIIA family hydrolase [Hyphomicrobium sp.]
MSLQAVILAGGKGTRLASRLNGRPKPLIDVAGTPLLKRQIDALRAAGVTDVVILVNHAAEQIQEYCSSNDNFGLSALRLIDDGEPRGTAGAVLASLDALGPRFLVIYGDTLFNVDFTRFIAEHDRSGAEATLFLHPNDHPIDSDLVSLNDDGMISGFHSKPRPADALFPNLVNAALYVVEREALRRWRDIAVPCDFGADLFPAMLAAGARLKGYTSFEYIKDIGTPSRLDKAEQDLIRGVLTRANLSQAQACVFLDRDGTLNELDGYIRTPEELKLIDGAANAVRRFNLAEHRVAVVTNQPVVARGECSFEDLRLIHSKLDMLLAETGAYVDRLYFCPHHPDAGFEGEIASLKIRCSCRKPEVGLLIQGAHDLNADLARSWMIGDSTGDILAAAKIGLRSILVRTGEGGRDGKYDVLPDFVVDDLAAAADFILNSYPRLEALAGSLVDGIEAGSLVLIGGAARTGKSTLTGAMVDRLRTRDQQAVVVPLDRWLRPAELRGDGVGGRFDIPAVYSALEPWLDGGGASFKAPFYDRFKRQQREGTELSIERDSVVIVEGVPALLLPIETERSVFRVHLKSDEADRRTRVINDLLYRGLGDRSGSEALYEARLDDETAVVERVGKDADVTKSLDECFSKEWPHA